MTSNVIAYQMFSNFLRKGKGKAAKLIYKTFIISHTGINFKSPGYVLMATVL
jgi:hypothetical protein